MDLPLIIQVIQGVALTIAVIVGGIWTYYQFFRLSKRITSLTITTAYTIVKEYENTEKLLHICIGIKNESDFGVAYTVPEVLSNVERKIILSRGVFDITYSYELQIRKIPEGVSSFQWFQCSFDEVHNQPINVLSGRKRFFLTPRGTDHKDVYVRLRKGNYVGIAVFLTTEMGITIFNRVFDIVVT